MRRCGVLTRKVFGSVGNVNYAYIVLAVIYCLSVFFAFKLILAIPKICIDNCMHTLLFIHNT